MWVLVDILDEYMFHLEVLRFSPETSRYELSTMRMPLDGTRLKQHFCCLPVSYQAVGRVSLRCVFLPLRGISTLERLPLFA